MKKNLLLVVCCLPLLGTSCPVPSVGVTCSNNLDASTFGFSAVVPAEFSCSTVFPTPTALMLVGYRQASTGNLVSIQVNPPQNGTIGDGVTADNLGNTTTGNNITFERFKVTLLGRFSYLAGTQLASGNNLIISVSGGTDSAALQTTLNSIIESVQLK